jgi:hypothetical protein
MAGCLDCGMPTQKRRCQTCRVEHNAGDGGSLTDHECPDCGGPTSGEGVTCATCRRIDDIVERTERGDA